MQALNAGEIIAYPTEAVWGLGCDPWNEDAVASLLALKRRPQAKGLILVASHYRQFDWLRPGLDAAQWLKLCSVQEEATTWLVPNNGALPGWICGAHEKVALRLSTHPAVVEICNRFGDLLVSTSANPAGLAPARSELAARRYFGKSIAAYVCGPTGGALNPSRIIDLESGARLR